MFYEHLALQYGCLEEGDVTTKRAEIFDSHPLSDVAQFCLIARRRYYGLMQSHTDEKLAKCIEDLVIQDKKKFDARK